MGSMEIITFAPPCGMRSEAIGSDEMRKLLCTSPPRWLIPCTSACLIYKFSFMAASPMIVAMERMPCPPTPDNIMSVFIISSYYDFLFQRNACFIASFFTFSLLGSCSLFGMSCGSLYAFAAGNDHAQALVVDFFTD